MLVLVERLSRPPGRRCPAGQGLLHALMLMLVVHRPAVLEGPQAMSRAPKPVTDTHTHAHVCVLGHQQRAERLMQSALQI